ncbi:MAG: hypothetical protein KC940_03365 [Candidatus Omnitrophica bacterium]|nr:hypothetical protein [Candidatus Omnitrophota bacterium]MCA9440418.1 hypothetical protein [Candidatus Omnitrophota bacterium]
MQWRYQKARIDPLKQSGGFAPLPSFNPGRLYPSMPEVSHKKGKSFKNEIKEEKRKEEKYEKGGKEEKRGSK